MAADPTFRNYKAAQAQLYAKSRAPYPPELYEHIFQAHEAGGGRFDFVVDVGCGPGLATRDLALAFDHALGVDPGEQMINVARESAGKTKSGDTILFEVCEAERLAEAKNLPLGQVDMITAATSAHWFDMSKFWTQAGKVLRPGGTVAIWCKGMYYTHPDVPHAAELNKIQDDFLPAIEPYFQPANLVAHQMYDNLVLPWTADPGQTAFPQGNYRRFDWDRGGVLTDGKDFLGGSRPFPLSIYEAALGTVSAVTRWREAHPDLANTERDCVTEMVGRMRQVVGDAPLRAGGPTVLLMFRRAE